jgi:PadR family transcriptional regulator PadR
MRGLRGRGQAIKGHLDMLLLAVLDDGPKHGYAIIEALRERSDDVFDLPEGTVYPALHRLEEAGLITSRRHEVQGRWRRTYEISKTGRSNLSEQRRSWEEFFLAIDRVLGEGPWPATSRSITI